MGIWCLGQFNVEFRDLLKLTTNYFTPNFQTAWVRLLNCSSAVMVYIGLIWPPTPNFQAFLLGSLRLWVLWKRLCIQQLRLLNHDGFQQSCSSSCLVSVTGRHNSLEWSHNCVIPWKVLWSFPKLTIQNTIDWKAVVTGHKAPTYVTICILVDNLMTICLKAMILAVQLV